MITASQAAEKWNMSVRGVQNLCRLSKVSGAERFGKIWMIPEDSEKPFDGRCKNKESFQPLIRKTPFLDMTDLYNVPGSADESISKLSAYPEAQALFAAEIAYSRGDIDGAYSFANRILNSKSDLFAVISGSMLLSLCSMWKGDLDMWVRAKKHLFEAPCRNETERDIVLLSNAAMDSAIRKTDDFPQWFKLGCFDSLPRDAYPAAMVYYIKYLLIYAQDLAMGTLQLEDVNGLGLMKTLPYIMEPMITQMSCEKIVMAEIYLRLLCGIAYRQSGNTERAALHVDKAIRLALPDKLYGPLVEHRRQLGLFLDQRIILIDEAAFYEVKALHKKLHQGWTKLHNDVLQKNVSVSLSAREREVSRFASFGLTNSEIAERLNLSIHSVNALIVSAKNKTGAESKKELSEFV